LKGQWKHPQDRGGRHWNDLSYWLDLAKILDEGKFHGLFLADHLGIYDVYKGPANRDPALLSGAQFPLGDPLYAHDRTFPAFRLCTTDLFPPYLDFWSRPWRQ
jgi:hypothetical protein